MEFQLWDLLCQVYFKQEMYPCILWISGRHLLLPFPNLIPSRINFWSAQAQPELLSELSSKSQRGPLQVTPFGKVRSIFNFSSQVIL